MPGEPKNKRQFAKGEPNNKLVVGVHMEIVQHIVASNIVVLEKVRKNYGDIPALAKNIKSEGLHNPIHVIESRKGQYVLLAGERRLKAVMLLGEPLIAVRVVEAKVRPENFYTFHRNYQTAKSTIKNKIMIKN